MGRRGPIPMAQHLRVLRGDTSGRKTRPTVQLAPGAPTPPTTLRGEALREWKRIVPLLVEKRVLSKADRALLTLYCDTWARARLLSALMAKEGEVVTDRDGIRRKHPAYQMWRECSAMATQMAKELLITPATRLRATLPEDGHGAGQAAASGLLD